MDALGLPIHVLLLQKNGHLDCLKYAHENGCSWDIETCANATYGCCLDCLKYAHENGCPWPENTYLYFFTSS